ncbi:MAG: ribulose-phosphate 3-epimerase, partial [Candidatus Magasanikbacteria bacterium]|nr:ribulose-phosphate 3-epimerase [Candidatus Magasanikbacteria bacterium]
MIIPAILVQTFSEFEQQAKKLSFSPIIQIDVMDGRFVPNKSFEEIDKINGLNLKTEWELHLMVEHPIAELEKWKDVKNIFRVIFHLECLDDIEKTIEAIKKYGFEAGIALNPKTPVEKIHNFLKDIEVVMFMTVYPGRQGAPFVPEVEKQVKKLYKI